MRPYRLLLASMILLASAPVDASVITIAASKDNTLYQAANGGISNGAGDYIFTGTTATNVKHRAVLAFNIAGFVPAGAIVTDVTLFLNVSRFSGGTHPVALHALLKDWGEGNSNASANEGRGTTASLNDATWTKAFHGTPGVPWATPGGDFIAASDSDNIFGGIAGVMSFNTLEMVDRVQFWLRNPAENAGWIIIGEESFTSTAIRFNSRSNPDIPSRPRLKIVYRCPADHDNNNVVDLFDYLSFVEALAGNDTTADFNGDQIIDFSDYLDFVQAFARGC